MPIRNRLVGLMLLFISVAAIGQEPAPAFDVATIKPTIIPQGFGGSFINTGYRGTYPIYELVRQAYFTNPTGNQLIGMPAWTRDERYDVVSHIDEATAVWWLRLNPRQQQERGIPMLRKLLVDRCQLVAHLVPAQVDGYALVVSKRGSHLDVAQPHETYPPGIRNADFDGGKVTMPSSTNGNTMQFFNATVQDLIGILGPTSGTVIEDQTGLGSRYDFTVRRLELQKDPDGNPILHNPKLADFWDISSTGLELRPTKIPSQNLIVDHIERPTAN